MDIFWNFRIANKNSAFKDYFHLLELVTTDELPRCLNQTIHHARKLIYTVQ